MALIVRNDEQIKVGTTTGLIAGSSSFTFDGTGGKPNYIFWNIVPSELTGRGILVRNVDYSWDLATGTFLFLSIGDVFVTGVYYNIHFQNLEQPASYNPSSIINSSFFVRDITIPNINVPVSGINANLERLTSFIGKYEHECLKIILGYPLYKLFLTESSQRMTNLLYGSEYICEINELQEWKGIVHDTDVSLIANYVYYFYQEAMAKLTTGVSTSTVNVKGMVSESPMDKMINSWNFFCLEVRSMLSFLWMSKNIDGTRTFPEFTAHQYLKTKNLSRTINSFNF